MVMDVLRRVGKLFEKKEKPIPVEKLPTTPEIIQRGVQQYQELLNHLPSELQKKFARKEIKACFIGVTPEFGGVSGTFLDGATPEVRSQVRALLEQYAPNIIIIEHAQMGVDDEGKKTFSLLNLDAAQHIVTHNKDLFPPDAYEDSDTWFKENFEEWFNAKPMNDLTGDAASIRYGLLSGFPRTAAESFLTNRRVMERLQTGNEYDKKLYDYLFSYQHQNLGRLPEHRSQLKNVLDLLGKKFTEDEKRVLLNGQSIQVKRAFTGYLGVDGPGDIAYAQKLDELYHQSGIDEVKPEKDGERVDIELPTTPEIASYGTKAFQEVLNHLPEHISKYFTDGEIIRCFCGVLPENGGESGSILTGRPLEEIKKIKDVLKKYSPHIVIVEHSSIPHKDKASGVPKSILNLLAAEKVIRQNADFFPPEALQDPQTWLVTHPEQWWDIRVWSEGETPERLVIEKRYGLLSGFPSEAVENYRKWKAVYKMPDRSLMNPEDFKLFSDYADKRLGDSPENVDSMRDLLVKIAPDLEDEEISVFLNSAMVQNDVIPGYLGFQGQADIKFITQLKGIFDKSGIEKVKRQPAKALFNSLRDFFNR